jgi:hypothetical protein
VGSTDHQHNNSINCAFLTCVQLLTFNRLLKQRQSPFVTADTNDLCGPSAAAMQCAITSRIRA